MESIEVDGVFNVRSVSGPYLTPGRLFRSATLDHMTDEGRKTLEQNGIRTVIDLRDNRERPGNTATASWNVLHHPLYDPVTGPPRSGEITAIYRALLDERGSALTDAVRALAYSPAPALVHCTAGKDRTGLVVAVAAAAVGVPDSAILDDYSRSGPRLRPYREDAVRVLLSDLALDPAQYAESVELHLDSPASALQSALDHIRRRHGSVTGYLEAHGFTTDDLAALRTLLLGEPELTVLHLSDVHARGTENPYSGLGTEDLFSGVDGVGRLRAAVEGASTSRLRPDIVVVTGDLAHRRAVSTYPRLAAVFDEIRTHLGCPALTVPGNHDDPVAFASVFGTNPEEHVRGFRVLGVDTSPGMLSSDELARLSHELASPAPYGTVIVMHHPPVPSPAATLTGRELTRADELAAVLRGSDVTAILAGHFHHPMAGVFAGVPVWVGGSLAYLQDIGTPADSLVAFDDPAYSLVQCSRSGVRALPVALRTPEVLFRSSPTLTVAS
ncbi:tyrosine-protein phosphatase [Rhodococcus sp. B50]|uniref:tyrosine-protein phosphatase n=1 Tax=Rhodococcus sp. B50 TaxID=2682847 RepID=UPI001BD5BC41|nr:tyrosine-protein phosphatase [Rhodococcus sp. B50]MBS9372395.1 3',5'-cyclic adenosine monophosphate phosphodiesterase CpdA [Rhodococcus sp. B50]